MKSYVVTKRITALFLLICLLFTVAGCTEPPVDDPSDDTPALDDACTHADADDNGICDSCDGSVLITVDFYVINDLHGKLTDGDNHPGVDELTTYLKQCIATDETAILLSSGDTWQGASASNLTRGLILTDWMNQLGFASMTLGNHEFDWGVEAIRENAALAEFPLLAINIYESATNAPADFCEPSVLVEQDGVTIGIIGAIGDCYSSISPDKVEGLYFKTGSELSALVKAESERLRAAGADLIVYSIHDGNGNSSDRNPQSVGQSEMASYYDASLSNGYVDLVFEGHTHQSYVMKDNYGVYHLQNGGDNRGISHVEMEVNIARDEGSVTQAEFVPTGVYMAMEDDPLIEQLLEKYADQVSVGERVLGRNDVHRSGNELRQKVAELYYTFGVERWGKDYDIVLGGGYLSIRSPGSLPVGDVTYAQTQSLFPFDNGLVLCSVKGSDLDRCFFSSENENYFWHCGAYGESVRNDINPNATYYIIVDTYSSLYAPNNLTEIERYEEDYFARDLLADYIREGGYAFAAPADMTPVEFDTVFSVGATLPDNAMTSEKYVVRGEIVAITNTTYGNMIIRNQSGTEMTIYGTYDETGTIRFDALSDPPAVGDTVTFCGPIKRYIQPNGEALIELVNAAMSEITPTDESPEQPPEQPAVGDNITFAQFYALGAALADNDVTPVEYKVTGRVSAIANTTYGNLYLTDDAGNELYVYGVYDSDGARYDAMENPPAVGDTVTLRGVIKKYIQKDGTALIELVNGACVD